MNKSLIKIVWQRHKWILIAGLVVIIGSYMQSLTTQYTSWKSQHDYYYSKEYKEMFEEEVKNNLAEGYDGAIYYVGDEMEERYTQDFDVYQANDLETMRIFEDDHNVYGISYYSYFFYSLLSLVTIFFGLAVFLFDNNGNFNQTLFSSRFTRKQIFWTKLSLFSLVFFIAHIIGTFIYLTGMYSLIPNDMMGASITELLPSVIATILVGGCYFFVSVLGGVIMGQWLFAVPTVMVFLLSTEYFASTIKEWLIVFSGQYDAYYNGYDYDELSQKYHLSSWVTSYGKGDVPMSQWLMMGAIMIVCVAASYWLFKRLSTDNVHQYIAFDFLKKPVLITAMVYIFFSVFSIPFFATVVYEKLGAVMAMMGIMLVTMAMFYIVFYLLIYRQFPFSKNEKIFELKVK
ncbi:hypothetical protein ACWN8B_00270 [Vagococcus zengguangii]|uniref:ABC transporter permease n=1 Tax=Vagococcus zengguangii TaxID=2571750 RepID=A0A4D7CVX5_9ENTE|nr:hypothetical protein [Vagococcus zengguangii]QCI86350.1 hypothetical protein FA707_04945 [Vagococcus zengguangii]